MCFEGNYHWEIIRKEDNMTQDAALESRPRVNQVLGVLTLGEGKCHSTPHTIECVSVAALTRTHAILPFQKSQV